MPAGWHLTMHPNFTPRARMCWACHNLACQCLLQLCAQYLAHLIFKVAALLAAQVTKHWPQQPVCSPHSRGRSASPRGCWQRAGPRWEILVFRLPSSDSPDLSRLPCAHLRFEKEAGKKAIPKPDLLSSIILKKQARKRSSITDGVGSYELLVMDSEWLKQSKRAFPLQQVKAAQASEFLLFFTRFCLVNYLQFF